ncbi:hypothetical protein ACFQE7_03800 [Nonomuraea ferruginea]|uniref:hypothetical protein n=1 Tax=Nonomuraea ferruginea TaxID=46174 RepID=UPI00360CE493
MSVYLEISWPPAWIRLAAHLEKFLTVHRRPPIRRLDVSDNLSGLPRGIDVGLQIDSRW